jgi:hypothetical protein
VEGVDEIGAMVVIDVSGHIGDGGGDDDVE